MSSETEFNTIEDLKQIENKNAMWKWRLAKSLEKSGKLDLATSVYEGLAKVPNPYRDRCIEWLAAHSQD